MKARIKKVVLNDGTIRYYPQICKNFWSDWEGFANVNSSIFRPRLVGSFFEEYTTDLSVAKKAIDKYIKSLEKEETYIKYDINKCEYVLNESGDMYYFGCSAGTIDKWYMERGNKRYCTWCGREIRLIK